MSCRPKAPPMGILPPPRAPSSSDIEEMRMHMAAMERIMDDPLAPSESRAEAAVLASKFRGKLRELNMIGSDARQIGMMPPRGPRRPPTDLV